MSAPTLLRSLATAVAFTVLAACGGGSDDPVSTPAPTPTQPPVPEGFVRHVGYYQEDPTNNPEDPMPGAFVLDLPTADVDFSGSMFFTYVGCQSSNVGTVSGRRAGTSLTGTWTGAIDGSPQSGGYTGTLAGGIWSGTYTNAGGKQHRDLSPCIEYDIAAHGTWEMFPVGEAYPVNSFVVTVEGRKISWSAVAGAQTTLVYVLDPTVAAGTNSVVWQTVQGATPRDVTIPTGVTLVAGREYIAAVGVQNTANQRAAFGSRRFTAP